MGLKILWNADRPREAYELALLGLSDAKMARVMGIAEETLNSWKRTRSRFKTMISKGRDTANAKVATALYKRAVGYSHPDVHISNFKGEITITPITKYYPPDVDACKSWLAMKDRENWSPRQQIDVNTTNINITKIDLTGLSAEELKIAQKMGVRQLLENNPALDN